MRFLFTTQPGIGHLLPLLPLANALRDAKHDVAFAASGGLAADLAAAGFTHHHVGRSWHTARMAEAFPEMATIPPGPARYAWARQHVFASATASDVVPDMLRLATEWRPDVIVREAAEYGGCITAEVLGIAHAAVRTDSGSSSFADRRHVAPALDAVRTRHGLPTDPDGAAPFRHLLLSFAPPGLDEDPFPPNGVQLRPVTADPPGAPPWSETPFEHRQMVYATLGTVYNSAELLADIIEALADEPLDLVVTTGGAPYESAKPSNTHVEPWIPQGAILPQCAAVITHGGYGTVSAAIEHGVPMVILPISADQPINAARLTRAGAAVTVEPDDRSPVTIRAATRRVLEDPTFRATTVRLAEEGNRRPDVTHGVYLLRRLGERGVASSNGIVD